MLQEFTHKGWFGLCPVYFANLDGDAPCVHPRHVLLSPLMTLSEWIFATMFFVETAMRPGCEPEWPLRVTGEVYPPRLIDFS